MLSTWHPCCGTNEFNPLEKKEKADITDGSSRSSTCTATAVVCLMTRVRKRKVYVIVDFFVLSIPVKCWNGSFLAEFFALNVRERFPGVELGWEACVKPARNRTNHFSQTVKLNTNACLVVARDASVFSFLSFGLFKGQSGTSTCKSIPRTAIPSYPFEDSHYPLHKLDLSPQPKRWKPCGPNETPCAESVQC